MVFWVIFGFGAEGLLHLNFPNWNSCIILPQSFCLKLPAVYVLIGPWLIHGIFVSQFRKPGKKNNY